MIISTMSFKGNMVVSAVYYRLVVHAGIIGRTRVQERHSPGQTERAEGDDQVIISTMSFKGNMVVSAVYYRLVVHAGIRER